jgi:hypothetical protein
MRRTATWVVVAGVLLVGGVAAVEAFLRDGEATVDQLGTRASTASPAPRGGSLAERLEAAGARGLLYVTVEAGDGCELRGVRLPRLTVESSFPVSDCRFAIAPDGAVATGSDCRGNGTLATFDGAVVDFFAGCMPAFKPDGELTFVRGGNVMTVPRSCSKTIDACARVVLSRRDIRRTCRAFRGSACRHARNSEPLAHPVDKNAESYGRTARDDSTAVNVSTTDSDIAVEPFVPSPTVLASIGGSPPAADTLTPNLGVRAVDLS